MKVALQKAQLLVQQSVLSLEREQPKEQLPALSSAERSLMRAALRKQERRALLTASG
jgi:hypothetical protein